MASTQLNPHAPPVHPPSPWLLPLLLGYALLALLGGVLHRPALGAAAIALLLAALGVAVLRRRSPRGIAVWLALAVLMLGAWVSGKVQLLLSALPIAALVAVAWLFARTLARGCEPLIARCIRVLEGEQRLALPGVARYARGVTLYWACVLGLQACALAALLLFSRPGGVLAAFGLAVPLAVPRDALAWYPEIGCWAVLALAFAAEYLFRRWHLRRLPHPPLKRFLTRLVRRWPQLLREEVAS